MTVWFTADLHVGDADIIRHCGRPFASVDEMDAALVENWNAVVRSQDDVWDLGDFSHRCGTAHAVSILERLNGAHHLVPGNHDTEDFLSSAGRGGLIHVHRDLVEIAVDGQRITLCHYPMREWDGALRGAWQLHGHVHGLLDPFGRSLDVGVDAVGRLTPGAPLRPVSFEELAERMRGVPVGPHARFPGRSQAALAGGQPERPSRRTREGK